MTTHQNCLDMIPPYYQPTKGVQIICASLCEFSSVCSRSGEKFQTFWPRGAATSLGLVDILIIGYLDGVQTSHQNRCVPVACYHDQVEKNGKVWHKFWWSLLPNQSISHEGSWFPKWDVLIQTRVAGDIIVWPHKYFHGRQSPLYHGFYFMEHFGYR